MSRALCHVCCVHALCHAAHSGPCFLWIRVVLIHQVSVSFEFLFMHEEYSITPIHCDLVIHSPVNGLLDF